MISKFQFWHRTPDQAEIKSTEQVGLVLKNARMIIHGSKVHDDKKKRTNCYKNVFEIDNAILKFLLQMATTQERADAKNQGHN